MAAIVNKYRDISLGRVVMLCDIIIITSSYLVFRDWEKVIYGYVVLWVSSFCIDQVVGSMRRSVQFFIISDKYQEIASRIAVYPHRGATVIQARGFYTNHDVKMLFIMAKRRESKSSSASSTRSIRTRLSPRPMSSVSTVRASISLR